MKPAPKGKSISRGLEGPGADKSSGRSSDELREADRPLKPGLMGRWPSFRGHGRSLSGQGRQVQLWPSLFSFPPPSPGSLRPLKACPGPISAGRMTFTAESPAGTVLHLLSACQHFWPPPAHSAGYHMSQGSLHWTRPCACL